MTINSQNTKVVSTLYETINKIIEEARNTVYRTANSTMVKVYWYIGREIVEEEQKGKEQAEYGRELIKTARRETNKNTGTTNR